jgi:hypothetical protein
MKKLLRVDDDDDDDMMMMIAMKAWLFSSMASALIAYH